jgi:allophanate hydrolase subunit 1
MNRKRRGDVKIPVKTKECLFYLQVKEPFEEFYKLLHKMMYEWDTNIVKGMNTLFTKFLPKDQTYATMIENMVNLYLAISIDSIRYTEVDRCFGEKTGLMICDINNMMNMELDEYKSYRRSY